VNLEFVFVFLDILGMIVLLRNAPTTALDLDNVSQEHVRVFLRTLELIVQFNNAQIAVMVEENAKI